jgi:hypothetical protein
MPNRSKSSGCTLKRRNTLFSKFADHFNDIVKRNVTHCTKIRVNKIVNPPYYLDDFIFAGEENSNNCQMLMNCFFFKFVMNWVFL